MAAVSDDDDGDGSGGLGSDDAGNGGDSDGVLESVIVVGQEMQRSSANAVAVDVLYVFTTAFFATLAIRGFWPALIAALPIAVLLSFAWMSSRLFFLANVLVIVVTIGATRAGYVPL
ncbi:hypothetical protein [Halostagnicola sp. A-GB9-2]|uniref:hypothetical protein n=1 Tax=Halostagnicola sp. A-GB9-2 TaxID=3048066 RepID=UPI0024BF46FD|nr:hypothetical protein [Halostagnicola sp. A-GB9-2]MDJ1431418.1 hypothetical protein [Halostagnicola sp. A-GB9-2]